MNKVCVLRKFIETVTLHLAEIQKVDKVDKVDTFYKVFSFLDFRIGVL
jgi:hypothetical protein